MKEEFLHSLDEVTVATGNAKAESGERLNMFLLTFSVFRQDAQGRHPPFRFPEIWMEPHEVAGLIHALQSKLVQHFPREAEANGLTLKMPDEPRLLS